MQIGEEGHLQKAGASSHLSSMRSRPREHTCIGGLLGATEAAGSQLGDQGASGVHQRPYQPWLPFSVWLHKVGSFAAESDEADHNKLPPDRKHRTGAGSERY